MNKLLLLSLGDYALTDILRMFCSTCEPEKYVFWESQTFSYICDMTGSFNICYNKWKRNYAEAHSLTH